ncbi:hypothetical protein Sjap_020803 [Stephania japonica]|uniref:K+ potassium transporter integral membrane domain-containing protein n=1 Tax=Stephania japonica TaxID=461633 RepID=A0AAP0F287_9MAGN
MSCMGQTPLVLDHHTWHSMVIGDGVLTPCISVLSAVSGIKQSAKSLNQVELQLYSKIARRLGKLQKRGWKPRRTIILCNWDAEEYGLVKRAKEDVQTAFDQAGKSKFETAKRCSV